ncbi:MAG: serine/threonine-protein kinase [Planctomycetota bacterium]
MSPDPLIGRRFYKDDRYEIVRKIGGGGAGVVYEARDRKRGYSVAIKFLRRDYCDREDIERFVREGKKFSRLRHPNIVRIYGVSRAFGHYYVASEFIDGLNLYQTLATRERLELVEALQIVDCVAAALEQVHAHKIIHRDLKPENLMIDREGRLKILDFGIAKDLDASVALTQDGDFLGTPGYTAPEQVLGQGIDHRADIFSLGVLLYELTTGELPFRGERKTEVLRQTLQGRELEPEAFEGRIAEPVARLIGRMIERDRELRPADCSEVRREIHLILASLEGTATEARRFDLVDFLRRAVGDREA